MASLRHPIMVERSQDGSGMRAWLPLSPQLVHLCVEHQVNGFMGCDYNIEPTFKDARAHLGVETQRQWSHQATARTTPALLALYSIVTLIAAHLLGTDTMPVRTAAWYRKEAATFSDTIALVRRWLWCQNHFSMSEAGADVVKIPRSLFERFTDALCYAA
jgi:hypothetical protein